MSAICGANCEYCQSREMCYGCEATCGRPFGGVCVAAEYIKAGGREQYAVFKQNLLREVNALLAANGYPAADALYELAGSYINLAYPLPNGDKAYFLDDRNIYLGTQIELADTGLCCGVAADAGFILICRYGEDGDDPELVLYQKR